ncbi:MAG: hypothetical protein WAP37_02570 [Solirubrobacterales bacterium]
MTLMSEVEIGKDDVGSIAHQLRELKPNAPILLRMAEHGQILELKCEMPQCYCPKGRRHFAEAGSENTDWRPSPDHYPVLKSKDGQLRPENVRLAHVRCNQVDFEWRQRTARMLAEYKSLEEIATALNHDKKARTIHGTNKWTPASVRKAYVS